MVPTPIPPVYYILLMVFSDNLRDLGVISDSDIKFILIVLFPGLIKLYQLSLNLITNLSAPMLPVLYKQLI